MSEQNGNSGSYPEESVGMSTLENFEGINSYSDEKVDKEFKEEKCPLDSLGLYRSSEVRVLVVDDDLHVCRLIGAALEPRDFQVDVVSEPAQVQTVLQGGAYQLLILDYYLPGLNPDDVLNWIHEYQPSASLIVVTAHPSVEGVRTCLRARAYDYLTKPFKITEFQQIVTRCLAERGLLRMSEAALREALGAVIRERRKEQGLTLARMAQRTRVSLGYLSQIELGKNSASIETLYRISLGLGIKMSELFQTIQGV